MLIFITLIGKYNILILKELKISFMQLIHQPLYWSYHKFFWISFVVWFFYDKIKNVYVLYIIPELANLDNLLVESNLSPYTIIKW